MKSRFLVILAAIAAFFFFFFYFQLDSTKGAVPSDHPKIVRLKQRLVAAGISEQEIMAAFEEAFIDERIYEPKEKELWLYKPESIKRGKACIERYKDLLVRIIEKQFMVEGEAIVGIHAVEVKFLDRLGDHRALDALLTRYLKEKENKTDWLEQEIISWFLFCKKTKTSLFVPSSEWGATGPMQFMPSTALKYALPAGAEPYSHFHVPDSFVSAANYLQQNGWKMNSSLHQPVSKRHLLYRAYNKNRIYVQAVKKFAALIAGS